MIQNKNVVAIIPARANSVGCTGKNYREISGKPLFIWSVEAALQSQYIDTVVLSTNDSKIISITEEYKKNNSLNKNIIVVHRPESLSGPDSKTEFAMLHAVSSLFNRFHMDFDVVCLLQPTSPARRNRLVDKCLEKMVFENFDSILTVTEKTPFFWNIRKYPKATIEVCKYDQGGDFYMFNKNMKDPLNRCSIEKVTEKEKMIAYPNYSIANRPMRQSLNCLDMQYHDNGNFYACERNVLYSMYQRTGSNPSLFITDFFESLQIDTEEDFLIMQKMHELYGRFI